MFLTERSFLNVLYDLENWGNYEKSSKSRDISKLNGIRLLLKNLGNPEKNFKIIHIAGTNGKGTTATMISSLLKIQGFSTGCYTSPHLIDIRERIMLNGRPVSKKKFTNSASIVLRIAHTFKGNPELSFFDLLTSIAFHVFKIEKMDWIVLETGLGGKTDSTNVTNKELCVLTKVGLDHQEILGSKLKEIANEKIGITRSGIPIIVSDQKPQIKPWLIEQFQKKKVPLFFVDDFFKIHFPKNNFSPRPYSNPHLESIKTSLCAMQILFRGNNAVKRRWLETAENIKIPGRLDLRKNVYWMKHSIYFNKILIDGSHNLDALTELIYYISKNKLVPFTLILGMVSDKLVGILKKHLKELCLNADKLIFTPVLSPRTATTKILENFIFGSEKSENYPNIKHVSSAEEALEASILYNEKPVIVTGSFYLVGEVLKILKNKKNSKMNMSKQI